MFEFIKNLPKAELHVHFDGTFTPEVLLKLAERNRIKIPYNTVEDVRKAWTVNIAQNFYEVYNIATQVLQKEQDFYDVMRSYLHESAKQGVKHAEVFFDTRTYHDRGIPAKSVIDPLYAALQDAHKEIGITGGLMLCFLRHLSEEIAFEDLANALPYQEKIIAIGLAGDEFANPAVRFVDVFAKARSCGFYLVAHAGERDGAASVRDTINLLRPDRIDHGTRACQDPELIKELAACKLPLTMCPLSNLVLGIVPVLSKFPIKKMLDAGVSISINSDDPAYFGGYIADNYWIAHKECGLTIDDLITCAKNSFNASFMSDDLKKKYLSELEEYVKKAPDFKPGA